MPSNVPMRALPAPYPPLPAPPTTTSSLGGCPTCLQEVSPHPITFNFPLTFLFYFLHIFRERLRGEYIYLYFSFISSLFCSYLFKPKFALPKDKSHLSPPPLSRVPSSSLPWAPSPSIPECAGLEARAKLFFSTKFWTRSRL